MAVVDLRNLDLNLLVFLDALLQERNVTRAAEVMGVSQPTTSAALQRLRHHFNDALLLRVGNRYELTPLARQLTSQVPSAMGGVRRVFAASDDFDPRTSGREFTIVMSDYGAMVLGDHLATVIAERAPKVKLRLDPLTPRKVESANHTLRGSDGLVLPTVYILDLPHMELHEDSWVIIADRDHPAIGTQLSVSELAHLPWVVAHHRPSASAAALQQLRNLGVEPEVVITVDSFLTVPFLVTGTLRIAMLPARLAAKLAPAAPIQIWPCPWQPMTLTEAFWWHPVAEADPAHRWLREAVAEAGRRVNAEDVPAR